MAGRPTKYRDHFPALAEAWACAGLTDAEIAEKLDISLTSLYEYDAQYPEFADARKRGKAAPDDEVEAALLRRAKGGFVRQVITRKDGETVEVIAEPDTTACIFWLCNRRRDKWKHVQKIEHSGSVDGRITILDDVPADAEPDA